MSKKFYDEFDEDEIFDKQEKKRKDMSRKSKARNKEKERFDYLEEKE